MRTLTISILILYFATTLAADITPAPLIGYTQFQSNLPGGRHANVRTMRAAVIRIDSTDHS